ncbi:hypothetical protein HPP92_001924 [Vanilla planifolia]|uniref:Protein kinase domain-containing protein n=1 Tax=Vanilla planifolia TaxID=51239 RepID=A0A835RUX1_VANPL|nr:hypothetical protein HPP92_001924 [Vanilla planifolia]
MEVGGGWNTDAGVVLVAVDVSNEISSHAVEWAVQKAVRPNDRLILLAFFRPFQPPKASSSSSSIFKLRPLSMAENGCNSLSLCHSLKSILKKWSHLHARRTTRGNNITRKQDRSKQIRRNSEESREKRKWIQEECVYMIKDLCRKQRVEHVKGKVEICRDTCIDYIADIAEEYNANWVILDWNLKESASYLSGLNCNIVLANHANPKTLKFINPMPTSTPIEENDDEHKGVEEARHKNQCRRSIKRTPISAGTSTPAQERYTLSYHPTVYQKESKVAQNFSNKGVARTKAIATTTEVKGRRSLDSLSKRSKHRINIASSPVRKSNREQEDRVNQNSHPIVQQEESEVTQEMSTNNHRREIRNTPKLPRNYPASKNTSTSTRQARGRGPLLPLSRPSKQSISMSSNSDNKSTTDQEDSITLRSHPIVHNNESVVTPKIPTKNLVSTKTNNATRAKGKRPSGRAMPVTVKQLPTPPPLCSFCKHKAPEHSKPPRRFSREEVEEATNGYIDANFLGEGGFGSVYRGVLKDGQVVAVKRHRAAGLQGATEFCTEVEVLSCVQHRNVVKLLGYCVEEEWLLIYEYACNGSLDKQLHGNSGHVVIEWKHRQKVAVGSARGLRYLHEDCRVGCIIHRDFRPKNILLTHDFEPMVGDFGLARWQVKDQSAEETRIIGALGYLAPEYLQTGKITEKTDVYAYGVMLMELITGVKALELNKREWQKNLHKLVNSPLENAFAHELIDSRLEGRYDARETECMMHVAALCISTDPDMRPCMSKVLRMLEEDVP